MAVSPAWRLSQLWVDPWWAALLLPAHSTMRNAAQHMTSFMVTRAKVPLQSSVLVAVIAVTADDAAVRHHVHYVA